MVGEQVFIPGLVPVLVLFLVPGTLIVAWVRHRAKKREQVG